MAENLPDTNVGNIEYTSKEDASDAVIKYLQLDYAYAWGVREAINSLPSADVAPVKYGEWISIPEMWGAFDARYYCSKCGKNAIINNSERYVLSDYCPHCGAIMGNKRGNENG